MSTDRDAQNDEMLALESIFDSDEFSKSNDNGEFSGQFYAFVSLPGEIKINYQFLPFPKRYRKNKLPNDDAGDLNQISVKFLPPLELSFTLPPDYPSSSPPCYTLICSWLDRHQLSTLCRKLDSLWSENRGLEILYLWMSFLKEESYRFLGLGSTINLSKLYSFNLRQLEKMKKFQMNEGNVADSSDCNKATTSCASEQANDAICKSNSEEKFGSIQLPIPGIGRGNQVKGRGRGRGRGRGKFDQKNLQRPGRAQNNEIGSVVNKENITEKLQNLGIAEGQSAIKQLPNYSCGKSYRKRAVKGYQPRKSGTVHDQRAVSCVALQTSLISHILDYNKILSEKEFHRNMYSCRICFDDKPGSQCTEFVGCGHVFCRDCVSSYFEVMIKDGNVHALTCPEEGCKTEALQSQICNLVSSELFLRYDELLLSSALDGMDDIVYCPRKGCQYPVTRDGDEKMARCAHCSYTFCVLCRMGYHGVDPCRIKMDSGLLAEYEAASDEKKLMLEKKYGRRQLQDLLEKGYSEQWIKENSKSCPHCHAAIEKSYGCNRMICRKCNTYFCWICNSRLDPSRSYNHFNNPVTSCYQKLFFGLVESDESDVSDFSDSDSDEDLGVFDD